MIRCASKGGRFNARRVRATDSPRNAVGSGGLRSRTGGHIGWSQGFSRTPSPSSSPITCPEFLHQSYNWLVGSSKDLQGSITGFHHIEASTARQVYDGIWTVNPIAPSYLTTMIPMIVYQSNCKIQIWHLDAKRLCSSRQHHVSVDFLKGASTG